MTSVFIVFVLMTSYPPLVGILSILFWGIVLHIIICPAPSDEGYAPQCGEMSRKRQRGPPPSADVKQGETEGEKKVSPL